MSWCSLPRTTLGNVYADHGRGSFGYGINDIMREHLRTKMDSPVQHRLTTILPGIVALLIIQATPATWGDPPQAPSGMVYIPGGEFVMGSPGDPPQANEAPAHRVRIAELNPPRSVSTRKSSSSVGSAMETSVMDWASVIMVQDSVQNAKCKVHSSKCKANACEAPRTKHCAQSNF